MRWVRGKLRGPCAFLVHRPGQEQIEGPASIADDFNPSVNSPQSNLIPIYRSGSFPRRIKQLR